MRANEFEKQVQQKMEELQLRPSPEVWEEVEKQIRKDKKRRRIIFWWLLPLLLTGAISFIIVQNENKSNSIADSTINNQTLPTESKPNEPVSIPAPTTTDNPALSSDKPVVDDISKKANPDDLPVISKDKKDILTRNSNQRLNLRRQSPVNIPGNTNITVSQQTNIEKTDQLFPTKEKTTAILDKDDKAIVKNEEVNKELIQPKVSEPLIAETKKDLANADSNTLVTVPTEMIKAETEKEKATVTISNPSLPLKNEKDPKWELGVEARAGLSNTWKGELFHLRKVVEVYSSSPNIGTGSGTAAGPFAPTVLIESPEQSFTGSLQVLAQRKLSTRLSVNFGLQYNYLSTRVKVGSEVQSSRFISNDFSSSVVVNSYYRPEGNSDYINRYHLLGVSAGLSWKLIERKKFSLSWDNTVSVDRLLSTNALLFDGNIRGYYKDFSAFRKTHYFITSGLSVPIMRGKGVELSLRPFISYGLTPVLKNSSDKNMHFLQYGAGLRFLFPRKN